jgi:hypothetical protein
MVSYEVILKQYEVALPRFTKLQLPILINGEWTIDGSIDIIDLDGEYWDTFDVRITVPKSYPARLFELEETGERIPKTQEWHNNVKCCLSTPAVMYSEMAGDLTLINWLDKFAHPYLANSLYKIKTGHYANEEFEHGTPGIIQGYQKVFRTSDVLVLIEQLELLTGSKILERNSRCFCNSGKKYKKCFLLNENSHRFGIPVSLLKSDLQEIRNYLKEQV